MSEEAGTMAMLSSRDDIVQNLSRQVEITNVDHQPQMSIDELLKVIKGANGMPVLFVPSSDGRLKAVVVDGLPNHHGCKCKGSAENGNNQDFRAWLLLMASLIATVTFTAGLAPPGGFWSADGTDDNGNKYLAGSPVMLYKSFKRYECFYFSNTAAFFNSIIVIGLLARSNVVDEGDSNSYLVLHIGACLCFFSASYIAGTWSSFRLPSFSIMCFLVVVIYLGASAYSYRRR